MNRVGYKVGLAAVVGLSVLMNWAADTTKLLEKLHSPDRTYVFVCLHRGDWRHAPENSIPAIEGAIAMGADMVEIDLKKTKDGHFVLSHDSKLDRCTNGHGEISEHTLAEIKELFVKEGQGGPDAKLTQLHPITLEEALPVTKGRILVNLDQCWWLGLQEIVKILHDFGVEREVVLKGTLGPDELKLYLGEKYFQEFLDHRLLFMPVIHYYANRDDGDKLENWKRFQRRPDAWEIVYHQPGSLQEPSPFTFRETEGRLWINTMWDTLCAGHTDEKSATISPDLGWGWALSKNATMIQTDWPAELLAWLKKIGRR